MEDEGKGQPRGVDVDHSALIYWLLEGNDPLPQPPPIRYSRPDHRLGRGDKVEIHDFREDNGRIIIDQNGNWMWADKDQGIVKFKLTGDLYLYTREKATRKVHCVDGNYEEEYQGRYLQKLERV